MTTADNLARLRMARGLTQSELARLAHTDQALISHYEAGRKHPSTQTLRALCEALGCTATELLGW